MSRGTFQQFGEELASKNTVSVSSRMEDVLASGNVDQTLWDVLSGGISPFDKSAINMRAMMRMRRGEWPEAEKEIKNAIICDPHNFFPYKMYADFYYLTCNYKGAQEMYAKALRYSPNNPDVIHDLGVAHASAGEFEQCLSYFDRALAVRPESAVYHHHKALILISAGYEKEGWEEMEYRLDVPGVCGTYPRPEAYWKGEDLTGKTLVVRAEQGFGDTIHFARYLPELARKAQKVYFYCQPLMTEYLKKYYPMCVPWPTHAPPPTDFDYHVNVMSLPRLFDGDHMKRPARKERGEDVGINWFGSPTHKADHLRSLPIDAFAAVANAYTKRLKCLGWGFFEKKPDFMEYFIERCWDWKETAEQVEKLDLVITVDTATAHLAGDLGIETWLLLPKVADFRWRQDFETTPWYESVKIYRQTDLFQWGPVLARVCNDIATRYNTGVVTELQT